MRRSAKVVDHVGVARATERGVVGAQAHVLAEQHLVEETGLGQAADPGRAAAGVDLVDTLDSVELDPCTAAASRRW